MTILRRHGLKAVAVAGSVPLSYFGFDAATYELDDTLDSGRVAVINVPDDEGVYQQVATTKVAYVGARHSGGRQYADDGTGTLLDPQPYAISAPEATNYMTVSRMGTWTGKSSGAIIVAGQTSPFDGALLGARVERESVQGTAAMYRTVVLPGAGEFVASLFVAGNSTAEGIGIRLFSFDTDTAIQFVFATKTFIPVSGIAQQPPAYWYEELPNGNFRLFLKNSSATDLAGQVWVYALNGGSSNTTVQVGESVTVDQCDVVVSSTVGGPPIVASGAEVTRDKDVIAAPLTDLNQAANSGYLEVDIAADSTPNILGAFLSYSGTDYVLSDGTTAVSVTGAAGERKLGWYAGPDGMNLCVDGVWGTEAAYDADLAAALGFFTDSTYPQQFRDFKLWDTASQGVIDAEMAT